jgi:hypothetical protein
MFVVVTKHGASARSRLGRAFHQEIAINPSGVPYEDVIAENVPLIDVEGEQVAHERQRHLHDHHLAVSRDGHDLITYLSQDVEWTYPVLTAVTTLSATLRETRRAIERRLALHDS